MVDLPDTIEISGQTYRTAKGHERAILEAIDKVAGNGHVAGPIQGKETGIQLDTIATRLDLIAKALQSLGQNKQLLEQFDRVTEVSVGDGTATRKQLAQLGDTVCSLIASLTKRLADVQQDIRGLEDLKEGRGQAEAVLVDVRTMLVEVSENQKLVLELLDVATRPPERVVPRLQPRPPEVKPEVNLPAEGVPAGGLPFDPLVRAMNPHQLLAYVLSSHPTVTLENLASQIGITAQGVSYRLYQAAKQTGQLEELKARLRQSMGRRPSPSAAGGSATPDSMPAGMS